MSRDETMVYQPPSDPDRSPPFFHIKVDFSFRANRHERFGLDYTYSELRHLVVDPYQRNETLMLGGKKTAPSDMERIRIWESQRQFILEARGRGFEADPWREFLEDEYMEVLEDLPEPTDNILMTPPVDEASQSTPDPITGDPKKVFVVHGRDEANRVALFTLLRSLHLEPIEWPTAVQETGQGSPSNDGVLTDSMPRAKAVVVLLTPDEDVRLKEHLIGDDPSEQRWRKQPRPNVIYEAGRARETHPEATIFFQVGEFDEFSDIAGLQRIIFRGGAPELKMLADRLKGLGCDVDDNGTDWLNTESFVIRR